MYFLGAGRDDDNESSSSNKLGSTNDSIQQQGSERKKSDLKICLCCIQFIKRIQHNNHLLRRRIHKFVKSQGFYWLVIVLVLLNTIILAIEYHTQPVWLENFQCKYLILSGIVCDEI